ncbi:MAG: DUF5666 domain-containing protein [Candidatus Omnitrophota bacterium]
MKRNIGLIIFLAASLVGGLQFAYSEDVAVLTEEVPAAAVVTGEIVGSVVSIASDASSLVVSTKAAENSPASEKITIKVASTTVVKQNLYAINLTDLTVGQNVAVKYQVNAEGQKVATEIVAR